MSDRRNLIYIYDGTFDGLMCCVYESYYSKTVPSEIISVIEEQTSLFTTVEVITDTNKSDKVTEAIVNKISKDTLLFIKRAFLSYSKSKEMLILKYLYLGFKFGNKVVYMLADDTVNKINKIVQNVGKESHLFKEFIRFSEINNTLVAKIEPKNIVLPLISNHFCDRFRNENVIIYDKTHEMALIYHNHTAKIVSVENFSMPSVDEDEKKYRDLWTMYYNTIGIKERFNPKCRMNMMPKRYWKNLTEFSSLFPDNDNIVSIKENH